MTRVLTIRFKATLLVLFQLLAFWPSVHWFYLRTRYSSDERAHLFALGAVILLWQLRLRGQDIPSREMPARSLLGCTCGVIAYALLRPFLPPLVSALWAVWVFSWSMSRIAGERRLNLPLWTLGCLSLPILPILQFHLGLPMRIAVADGAAAMLRVAGLSVVGQGTSMDWNGALVWVDPPCSGLHMLWTGLFMAACLCSIWKLGNLDSLFVGLAAVLLIMGANTMRAASLFLLEAGLIQFPASAHDGIGIGAQCLAALAIFSVAYRLRTARGEAALCAVLERT